MTNKPTPASQQSPAPDDQFVQGVLVELANRGASAAGLKLAAQLFGAGACDGCGYRKMHCRCIDPVPYKHQPSPARSDMVEAERESILADLDFTPDQHHTIADMANVGYSLMECIKVYRPDYSWNDTPAEIVGDLAEELAEARATSTHPASDAQERPLDLTNYSARVVETNTAQIMAERAPSGESIDTPEFRMRMNAYISFATAPKLDSKACRKAWDEFITHIDARSATAGTTAAPSSESDGWNGLCQAIIDLEPATDKHIEFKRGHDAACIAACRLARRATAGNAATTAPGDLPPLPKPYLGTFEYCIPGEQTSRMDNGYTADQMREYGRACIASNAGAAPEPQNK